MAVKKTQGRAIHQHTYILIYIYLARVAGLLKLAVSRYILNMLRNNILAVGGKTKYIMIFFCKIISQTLATPIL